MRWKTALPVLLACLMLRGYGEEIKPPEETPEIQEMHKKLARKVTFEFVNTPLDEALKFLGGLVKVNIALDPKVEAEGVGKTPITLKVTDMELEQALAWVAKLAELDYGFRNQTVLVTHRANLANTFSLEIYDVRDLTAAVIDFPAPRYSLDGQQAVIVNPFGIGAAGGPMPGLQAADLVSVLKEKLLAAEFADPGTSIEENNGKVIVMQRPEVQKQIRQYLRRFRDMFAPQVLIKGYVAAAAEVPEETYFDEEGLAKVLRAGTVVAAPRLICFNKQLAHTLDGKLINYIGSLSISGTCHDPLPAAALEGLVLEARPRLSADRNSVELDLRFDACQNISKRVQTLGWPEPATATAVTQSPADVADKGKGEKPEQPKTDNPFLSGQYEIGASLDLLSADSNYVRTQVVAPAGKWVLAAVLNSRDPRAAQKYLLLFVSAEVMSKKLSDKDFSFAPPPQPKVTIPAQAAPPPRPPVHVQVIMPPVGVPPAPPQPQQKKTLTDEF